MGIRENLNKNPAITTGATIAIILIALGFIVYQLLPAHHTKPPTKAWFTTDGKTWFADDISKMAPFDKDGAQAYKCYVYKCDGTEFIAYEEKYTDQFKKQMEQAQKASKGAVNPGMMEGMDMGGGRLIKRPDDKDWLPSNDPKAIEIEQVKCKDDASKPPAFVPAPD